MKTRSHSFPRRIGTFVLVLVSALAFGLLLGGCDHGHHRHHSPTQLGR